MFRSAFALLLLPLIAAAESAQLQRELNVNGLISPTIHLSRTALLKSAGIPIVESTHQIIGRSGMTGISGYSRVAGDDWVGMGGLATCIGMVVLWQAEGESKAMVAHFAVGHDPKATLDQYEAKHGHFIPPGAIAYVAGGEDDWQSRAVLQSVIEALAKRKAKINSYHPYSSLWVNAKDLLPAYSFDHKSIYAGGYVSAQGEDAMKARQRALVAENKAATDKSIAAREAAVAAKKTAEAAGGE